MSAVTSAERIEIDLEQSKLTNERLACNLMGRLRVMVDAAVRGNDRKARGELLALLAFFPEPVPRGVSQSNQRWFVDEGGVNVLDENRLSVALVNNEDDAPLIAAAPEMLDVLKTTAGNIRSLGPNGALRDTYTVWLGVVDLAIATAEGRSP